LPAPPGASARILFMPSMDMADDDTVGSIGEACTVIAIISTTTMKSAGSIFVFISLSHTHTITLLLNILYVLRPKLNSFEADSRRKAFHKLHFTSLYVHTLDLISLLDGSEKVLGFFKSRLTALCGGFCGAFFVAMQLMISLAAR